MLLVLACAFAVPAFAQDDDESDATDAQQAEAAPTAPEESPSPANPFTTPPATGDILVQEGILFGDWQRRRADLDTAVGGLREAIRTNQMHDILAVAYEFEETIDRYMEHAGPILVEDSEEVEALVQRMEHLIVNFIDDWESGNQLQLLNTLRLIEQANARLEEIARLSDLRNDRVRGPFLAGLPLDWGPPKYPDESMRLGLSMLSADEILQRLGERSRMLHRSSRQRRIPAADVALVYEVGELGRALVLRQNEFPELMRPGFRNAALRIDVISENLADFLIENDRAAYRRQLIELERAMERLDDFYVLRDRTVRERIRQANE